LAAWYKADGVLWTTATTSRANKEGDQIVRIDDASGNGNHATRAQGDAAVRMNVQNGRAVIRMAEAANTAFNLATNITSAPVTVLAVVKNRNVQAAFQGLFVASKIGVYAGGTTGSDWGAYVNTSLDGGQTLGSFKQISAVFRAANDVDLVTNGSLVNRTNGASYQGRTGTAIAADPSGVQFTSLDLAELIVYNRALTVAERLLIESYLKRRWAT